MFPTATLLSSLFLALLVAGNPVVVRDNLIRLPITKRVNTTNAKDVLRIDQARAKTLHARGLARANARLGIPTPASSDAVVSFAVQNQAVDYVATVGVGSPATDYSLLIDTGSSNTWVGAGKAFVHTSTTAETADTVSVTYGSGDFSGNEFTDTVTLASGLVITAQSIGVATSSEGFDGVDGILGIGPVDLTLDTLSPAENSEIPTVTDNLFTQGVIPAHEVAVSFEPTTSLADTNGELTFGGTDSSKFTGSITFTPITTSSPANEFWGITQSLRYGTSTTLLTNTAGIVDTGTTLLLISPSATTAYQKATGAVEDETTGLLRLTTTQFSDLESLFFTIGGTTFEFTANAQAWPRSLNTAIGGNTRSVYLIVASVGDLSSEGINFINGFAFLERFYSVFDTANSRVGIATTSFTDATTN